MINNEFIESVKCYLTITDLETGKVNDYITEFLTNFNTQSKRLCAYPDCFNDRFRFFDKVAMCFNHYNEVKGISLYCETPSCENKHSKAIFFSHSGAEYLICKQCYDHLSGYKCSIDFCGDELYGFNGTRSEPLCEKHFEQFKYSI